MELQSQSNSTDTGKVQDELKHSVPILSSTHSKGIHKCYHGGCGRNGCCQQVVESASDAYALACERRQTFSGHKSMLNRLYSNFTADVDNALLFLHRKIYWLKRHGREIYLSVSFIDVIWLRPWSKSAGWEPGIFQCIGFSSCNFGSYHCLATQLNVSMVIM